LIITRSLLVVALTVFLSVASTKPISARENLDITLPVSSASSPDTSTENSNAGNGGSWFQDGFPVTFDELLIASAAIVATFAAAAGSIVLFVPPEAQLAVFTGLIFITATPIDGLIIGGGAIAVYRYFRGEPADADLEPVAPSWIDRWTYAPN
jgi:hypothetical protein